MRTFVFVGILGGFTTFSSFMLDTFTLSHGGDHTTAFWNVALQTAFGLAAVWSGYRLGLSIGYKLPLDVHFQFQFSVSTSQF
jgi:CrcB protein